MGEPAGLERKLSSWQQGMIAIGGTIGVGLFLGSGATIGLAGPAVVVTYLVAAVPAIAMGFALAEMATAHPVAGSFGVYADLYVGRWAGFVSRCTYWFAETLAIGAQVTAVGVYCGYWFPGTPAWIFMAAASAVAVSMNALHVGQFGTLDAIFSLVKVVAIVAFIVLGTALVVGAGGPGLENLSSHGGFFPGGIRGLWLASTLVITSFLGVEAVAVTAGEAARPEVSVPRALFGVVGALILIYTLAVLVIVAVSPWTVVAETSGTLTGSPFVKVLGEGGVPYAAGLMNGVVLSAAFTAAVSHLYLGTRILFSLARDGFVPATLGTVDRRGVPLRALAATTAGTIVAIFLASRGRQVFLPMYGTGVAALLSIWILIFVCHVRFRSRRDGGKRPVPSVLAIAVIAGALSATPWVAGLEWTVPMFLLWLVLIGVVYVTRERS
jgi:L-asparagine transporter-like permease